ncbi:hypothetical protein ARMSODRAFT_965021 [Armillaria solidipes]|uniref:Uncharacterized protein n=1 Tax=Armillaria solidipes TaxID=1076256 RepID=A0A2H3BBM6_9AGAR|nr:hypothetical protein ARMSODRAFT_965021 [Armillaria solidipes]
MSTSTVVFKCCHLSSLPQSRISHVRRVCGRTDCGCTAQRHICLLKLSSSHQQARRLIPLPNLSLQACSSALLLSTYLFATCEISWRRYPGHSNIVARNVAALIFFPSNLEGVKPILKHPNTIAAGIIGRGTADDVMEEN